MTRRATIRTAHADPEAVAAALAPDNTDEMETRVAAGDGTDAADGATGDGDASGGDRRVVTEIERESTSGLQSTIDDTLVNLAVAEEVATHARSRDAVRAQTERSTTPSDGSTTDDARPTEDASTDDRQRTDTNDTP